MFYMSYESKSYNETNCVRLGLEVKVRVGVKTRNRFTAVPKRE